MFEPADEGKYKAEMNEASYDDAIAELRNIVDQAVDLGEEARELVRQYFRDELSRLEGYGAFDFAYSSNRYDVTLGRFVDRLEEEGYDGDIDDDDLDEGIAKTQKAHGLVVAKMKELAKQYKAGDKSVIAQLKDLTAKKKQLEKQLEKDVAGKNRGQQLDPNINEYRGVQDDLISIIKDKAEDSGFSHEEETEEIIEFLQGIEFDDNGSIAAVYETVKEEKATYCGGCGKTHKKSSGCPK
jgi:DNA repair exonuclease SbcCD ATPase subunit